MAKGNLPENMLKQFQQMQSEMLKAQSELAKETVVGTAGGGTVRITLSGDQRCLGVEIDPGAIQDGGVEMLQDMVLAACNDALEKSRKLALDRLGPLSANFG
jgi:hypothetical protein